mgnify:CR=1 FL=1
MQPQPHQGNLAHAAAELGKTLLSVKGTFYATILIEALPFVNTWRSFDVKSTGLPPVLELMPPKKASHPAECPA